MRSARSGSLSELGVPSASKRWASAPPGGLVSSKISSSVRSMTPTRKGAWIVWSADERAARCCRRPPAIRRPQNDRSLRVGGGESLRSSARLASDTIVVVAGRCESSEADVRRIALVVGLVGVLVAFTSAIAAAHLVASGRAKHAIVRSLPLKRVTGHCKAVRCWRVSMSSGWATSFDVGPGNDWGWRVDVYLPSREGPVAVRWGRGRRIPSLTARPTGCGPRRLAT